MATSRWADVVNQLVALMRLTSGYREPIIPGTGRPVYDGPEFPGSDYATEPEGLIIGWSSGDEGGVGTQSPIVMAANVNPRDEEATVRCLAWAAYGDDMNNTRASAFSILADVETLLRTDSDLSLTSSSGFRHATVSSFRVRQRGTTNGFVVEIEFDVTFTARLL